MTLAGYYIVSDNIVYGNVLIVDQPPSNVCERGVCLKN